MNKCYYCGNNPIPHTITKVNDWFSSINNPLVSLGSSPLGTGLDYLFAFIIPPLVALADAIGFIRLSDDIEKANNGRSKVIWEEAKERGVVMEQITIFGRPLDLYRATLPSGRKIVFESLPMPISKKTPALTWLDDKLKLKKVLEKNKIPAPRGGVHTRFSTMLNMFNELSKPVIVKPALGSRGRHTTTFIYTEEQLKKAFDIAKQIAHRLVIEEHLIGPVYRGTVVDGVIRGVLRGDPPRITGDGKSTIAELIEIKNQIKHERMKDFKITPLTEPFLARNNYTLETILPKGKTIDLTEKIGLSYGGFAAEELPICHPKTKATLEGAAKAVDFPLIGFDFIIEDITRDPDTQRWGIIEGNSLPFIDLHHHPAEGEAINVAKYVWDWWLTPENLK